MNDNNQILQIGRISKSRLDLKTMLNAVARSAVDSMGADACAILLLDETGEILTLNASIGLSISAVDSVRLPKNRGISWRIVREKRPVALSIAKIDPDYYYVPVSGEDRFMSMLGVPIVEGEECFGAMYVQSVEVKEYWPEDIKRLESISREVAGAIQASLEFKRIDEKASVLNRLNETANLLNATNNEAHIIGVIAGRAKALAGARRALLWFADDKWNSRTESEPEIGQDASETRILIETLIAYIKVNRHIVNITDIGAEQRFPGLEKIARISVLCCPMIFEGRLVGAIVLADKETDNPDYYTAFSGDEAHALQILSQTAAQAVERAIANHRLQEALEENKRNVSELSVLFELSMAMQRAINLDDLLRVILSSVTVGRGLGFNRGIMFLVNENTGQLRGMIGMGPDSAEHAGHIWSELENQTRQEDDLAPWLAQMDGGEHSQFNNLARSLSFPLSGGGACPVIKKVVEEKTAVNIHSPKDLAPEDWALANAINCENFAIVPLVARDVTVGAILVDNLYNRKQITEADLKLLTRFAGPAAWAIENLKLFEKWANVSKELLNLESQMARVERLSTLGEMSAEIAHELINPLAVIGGFARRLGSIIPENQGEARKASGIIYEEVQRLEGLLKNTLDMSRDFKIERQACDLNEIVQNTLDVYLRLFTENGIEVSLQLEPEMGKILIDPIWIRQVVINLLLNAMEAMKCERHRDHRKLSITTGISDSLDDGVHLCVSDTGGGIADDDLRNVLNPFFTTKPHGTGLGLSLCNKIIRKHHGSMKIDNNLGVGVTFMVDLPCQPAEGNVMGNESELE